MITVALLCTVLVAALGFLFFFLTKIWSLEVSFVRVSWIPLAALLLEGVLFGYLMRALSYFAIAIPVLTCFASIFLTFIGATLSASARERGDRYAGLLRATIIASIPGALLVIVILYAFLTRALGAGL